MEVNPSVSSKTVPEFIAYAKANPGKISMASAGIGSGPHVAGELFKMMAAVNTIHVPYRGQGPALTDLLGGQVQFYFAGIPSSIQYLRAGKLRALAVTTATRSEVLPRNPDLERLPTGLRGELLGRLLCAQGHACGDSRQTQQRNKHWAR
jgi:tripartite-type tricarboxylate transporter receptor subunit TctC